MSITNVLLYIHVLEKIAPYVLDINMCYMYNFRHILLNFASSLE